MSIQDAERDGGLHYADFALIRDRTVRAVFPQADGLLPAADAIYPLDLETGRRRRPASRSAGSPRCSPPASGRATGATSGGPPEWLRRAAEIQPEGAHAWPARS